MLTPAKQTENQATKPTTANGSFFRGGSSTPFFQAKLTVNQPGDEHEREAEAVADQVMRMKTGDAPIVQRMPLTPVSGLQRACATCAHEQDKEKEGVQRKETGGGDASGKAAPSIVSDVLSSGSGQPMDGGTRQFMESRFGHDFSQVRIHTNSQAAESASAIQARAYTSGRDVVFGSGEYQPGSESGQRLLAHELVHVGQQGEGVYRAGWTFGGFFKNLANAIGIDVKYSNAELQQYIEVLDSTNETEGDFNSDDKARAILAKWRNGKSPFVLTAPRKKLLLKELIEGFTGDDDEMMILELLYRSYNFELSVIFGGSGITPQDLDSNFHGIESTFLDRFFDSRFEGGKEQLMAGTLQPIGEPQELGIKLTGESELFDSPSNWNVNCLLGILCTMDKPVVDSMSRAKLFTFSRAFVDHWSFKDGEWQKDLMGIAGIHREGEIYIQKDKSCGSAAETVFHEVKHFGQPKEMTRQEKEKEAYLTSEKWSIDRGIPGHSNFRKRDEQGKMKVDEEAVNQYVKDEYGGNIGGAGKTIIGHDTSTDLPMTKWLTPSASTSLEPSKEGDNYIDDTTLQKVDEKVIPSTDWKCP